jgi:hypothetical protein
MTPEYRVCVCRHDESEHGWVSRMCTRCDCTDFWPAALAPRSAHKPAHFSRSSFCLCGHVADFEHGRVSRICLLCECKQFRSVTGSPR